MNPIPFPAWILFAGILASWVILFLWANGASSSNGEPPAEEVFSEGVNLRDWFAGQALAIQHDGEALLRVAQADCVNSSTIRAQAAYEVADAMLAERVKDHP